MDEKTQMSEDDVVEQLAQVKGIGDARARQMYAELGVRSVEELVAIAKKGDLTSLSGIGSATQKRLLEAAEAVIAERQALAEPSPAEEVEQTDVSDETEQSSEAQEDESSPDVEPVQVEPELKVVNDSAEEEAESVEEQGDAERDDAARDDDDEGAALKEAPEPVMSQSAQPEAPTRLQRFLASLICPNCGNDDFEITGLELACTACRREYTFKDGVVDLSPPYRRRTSLTQRVMESRFYSNFYEDVMRPRLTQLVTQRSLRQEYALSTELLDLEPSSRVLDVACGTANFTRYFAQRLDALNQEPEHTGDYLLVGVDLSWPMLTQAQQYIQRDGLDDQIFLVHGDATRLPIGRDTFDRVHCAGALHLMEDIDEALRNFACVLETGGVCVIATFLVGDNLMRKIGKRLAEIPTQFHWFTPGELRQRLNRAGFEVIEESVEGDAISVKARKL